MNITPTKARVALVLIWLVIVTTTTGWQGLVGFVIGAAAITTVYESVRQDERTKREGGGMSEREPTPEIIDKVRAVESGIQAMSDEICELQARARIAEQIEAELAELLTEAIKALPVNHETHIRARAILAKREQ